MPENLAEKEIERNDQLIRQSKDDHLSLNHMTNNRMLPIKRLQSVFSIDTMFATKNMSTKSNTCCKIFLSDESYVFCTQ